MTTLSLATSSNTLFDRFAKLNWGIITILIALAFIGVLMHFSVSSGAWTDMPLTHGMRFALLVELLRGNHPEPGELPTITVVEGVNPYVEIEMADCYNALKAWYDKRFSKVDVEGFE